VYKIQKTGITWNLADITVTDITGPPLPSNVYDSDVAVETAGTVWLTVSSVLWTESTGEFTNNHVYRLPAGSSTWETRSNGLAQANPINSIVIDPDNENRLFCGGDIGVFRTEDAGANWAAWDEGLPNVPIFDLAIHGPRRLLRAATHGRGIWERPIDSSTCPMVDLYMRDNVLDTGRVQPSPESSHDPFDPTKTVRHWHSVDIKVDAPEPDYQTPSAIGDYVAFESDLEHRNTRRNRTNRFYVQVHNRGISKATNVQVRAFFANASAGLPTLPADFWSSGKPFTGDPSGTDWTPIGPTKVIPELEPAEPGIVEWDWFVPDTAATHSCLLAFATCTEDPLDGTGVFDADILVRNRKQVTLKNLHVDNPVLGGLQPEQVYILEMNNPERGQSLRELVIDWGNLPNDTIILLAFEKLQRKKLAVLAKPEDLKRSGIAVIRGKKKYFREKMEYGCGEIIQFDLEHIYQMSRPKDRSTIVPSIRIPEDRPLLVAINVILSGQTKDDPLEFDVFQQSGKWIIGGSTYLLHPRKNK